VLRGSIRPETSSPEKQGNRILSATGDSGSHIIAWAADWEVSGATDPLTRPGFGPWLRGEMGPYDGIVSASVDRVGRNVRDTLNTQALLTRQDRIVITADHAGVWDFSDPNEENNWIAKAWGSQMELRAIQKRNRNERIRVRDAGEPKQRPSYGYMYVRLAPTGRRLKPAAASLTAGPGTRRRPSPGAPGDGVRACRPDRRAGPRHRGQRPRQPDREPGPLRGPGCLTVAQNPNSQ
jgi:DNA invertase Pin-like site-specific DNA recombinase